MKFSAMTNFDFLRTLKPEEFAHLFVKLRCDAAEEEDWVEWMSMPCKKDEWEKILN
jgi:hypothetical protein